MGWGVVGPRYGKISTPRRAEVRRRLVGLSREQGSRDGGIVVLSFGGRYIPGYPVPIIVLAIDYDVRYVASGDARPIPRPAPLWLAGRRKEDSNVVEAPVCNWCCKSESRVASH